MVAAQVDEEERAINPPGVVNQLVIENLGLAGMVARKYAPVCRDRAIDEDDFYQVAVVGLIRAARIFNPAKGKFSTLAVLIASQEARNILNRPKDRARLKHEKPMPADADGVQFDRADPKYREPAWVLEERRAMERLRVLKDNEREVLLARLVDGDTLDTIGKRQGVTRERVRQIEAKAICKLRVEQDGAERAAKKARAEWWRRKAAAAN
jgi:RNA polymerase sigma factor (sigma-70 family)